MLSREEIPKDKTIEVARLAVKTGFWILYEMDHGTLRVTYRPKERKSIKDYLQIQGRFTGLRKKHIETPQDWVDEKCKELGL
ncbi:MAG: hypothetical protein JSV96_18515 [Candidatus Aminicenantes bacterium]|nr:MAG: hypothetical protein JSV96_18515 [Candidatus Aminicenantes bacterium]